jgi:hypothetical protein
VERIDLGAALAGREIEQRAEAVLKRTTAITGDWVTDRVRRAKVRRG